MDDGLPLELNHLPEMPSRKDVPIGCIGAGFIMSDCHLVAYRQAGFHPVAIASRSEESARAVAARHGIPKVYRTYYDLLADGEIEVVDVAVPPDIQHQVIRDIVQQRGNIRAILAQKPLGVSYEQAVELVDLCEDAGIVLAVNQNMRYDQSVRACKHLLESGLLGQPVLATLEMRAIPHWMPWQERQGWVTLRIMSIHHLDSFRYWFGSPRFVMCSVRPDPRTATKFAHEDGIALYILEYEGGLRVSAWDDVWSGPATEGAAADIYIRWRVEGTEGVARGTIGWPSYPKRTPSTLDFTTLRYPDKLFTPRWPEVWFPDAFAGPMADLLCALEAKKTPALNARDNLQTMALVDACYAASSQHRVIDLQRTSPPLFA